MTEFHQVQVGTTFQGDLVLKLKEIDDGCVKTLLKTEDGWRVRVDTEDSMDWDWYDFDSLEAADNIYKNVLNYESLTTLVELTEL